MLSVEQPIIAAISGEAIRLGCNIWLFCDLTCIAEDAKIIDTHTKMGLVAVDGGAASFPLLIGTAKARDFLMCGRVVDGIEANALAL